MLLFVRLSSSPWTNDAFKLFFVNNWATTLGKQFAIYENGEKHRELDASGTQNQHKQAVSMARAGMTYADVANHFQGAGNTKSKC